MSYLGIAETVITATPGQERDFLRQLRQSRARTGQGGFASGWIAALGYEFGVSLLGLTPAADTLPSAFALRLDAVIAIDHRTGRAELRGRSDADLDAWIDAYGHTLRSTFSEPERGERPAPRGHPAQTAAAAEMPSAPRWRHSDDDYLARVDACRDMIRDGEAYVLCLTDTATVTGVHRTPREIYLQLRAHGAAVRGGIIATEGRALVSASPERFLSVTDVAGRRRIATHPIKGTRPRGTTPEQDAALADELVSDPKERAENLMIVDLMRNDFSAVCDPATISVSGFLRVESHPHVHQLVSSVVGALNEEAGIDDVILACFPGGSMMGTPKRRAVELLQRLEAGSRGLYSGCFGWIDDGGAAELAMTIRGIELRADPPTGTTTALVGAGGGITFDSVAQRELAEKKLKAQALLAALDWPARLP